MELHLLAQHQPGLRAAALVGFVAKQDVQRGQAFARAPAGQRLHQGRALVRTAGQQPAAGDRREGGGHDALEPDRAGGGQCLALPEAQQAQRPAAVGHGRAAAGHGLQVGVAHEGGGRGLHVQQAVPDLGRDRVHALEDTGDIIAVHYVLHLV